MSHVSLPPLRFSSPVKLYLSITLQHQEDDDLKPSSTPGSCPTLAAEHGLADHNRCFLGYKPTAAKSAEEYAKLDAEDESLARWKASLGIVPGSAALASGSGPKVDLLPPFPRFASPY